jgi:hypothetical protein
MAGDTIGVTGGKDAKDDANDQRENLSGDHQQQGRRKLFKDQGGDRAVRFTGSCSTAAMLSNSSTRALE